MKNDGEPEILPQNQADNDYIYRAELDGTTVKIRPEGPVPTGGLIGYGDGDIDIVFTGTSQELKYLDDGTVTSTGVGSSGNGPLADFDFDGVPRVAYAGGSGNIKLLDKQDRAGKTTLLEGMAPRPGPILRARWHRGLRRRWGSPVLYVLASVQGRKDIRSNRGDSSAVRELLTGRRRGRRAWESDLRCNVDREDPSVLGT